MIDFLPQSRAEYHQSRFVGTSSNPIMLNLFWVKQNLQEFYICDLLKITLSTSKTALLIIQPI